MKNLPEIHIKIIPHNKQRYDTCGDYWKTKKGNWEIRISEMDPVRELAVLEHELSEMVETILNKVKWSAIDYFDTHEGRDSEDPGAMKSAPYHSEHMNALKIERLIIKNFKRNWGEYCDSFNQLIYK